MGSLRFRTDSAGEFRVSVNIQDDQGEFQATEMFAPRAPNPIPSTYSSYIAAVEGKRYEVIFKDLRADRATDLSVEVLIDGVK
jgi:hypothetical protein